MNNEAADKKKVLIVDDSGLGRMMLKKKIQMIAPGVGIDEAGNGKEGVAMVKAAAESDHAYDMIFLDQMMPKMDGIEALSKIRDYSSDVPVIMITANVQDKCRERAMQLGCTDFIPKTTEGKRLPEILGRIVER